MPTIELKRSHSVALDEARRRIHAMVDEFLGEHPSLVSRVDWTTDGLSAQAKGKGFSGSFAVDQSTLVARIDLSMLLAPVRGRVEASLARRLDRAFPEGA